MTANGLVLLLIFLVSPPIGILGSEPVWNTLRVTWGIFPVTTLHPFRKMPLTATEAKNKGFEMLNSNSSCEGDKFQGFRYAKNGDPGVIMIYDVNGYLAGLQCTFAENEVKPSQKQYFQMQKMFTMDKIDDKSYYIFTAYLINPEIICTKGRTEDEFEAEKGGSAFYFINGSNPQTDITQLPLKESDLRKANPVWTKERCFPSMGLHYWYNATKDMDCNYLPPLFLMFNHHKLSSFGVIVPGGFRSSYYENPPEFSDPLFLDPPKCVHNFYKEAGRLTGLHIYLNMELTNVIC